MKRPWEAVPTRLIALVTVFGAAASGVNAAEWSVAPTLALSVDHDSNRNLVPQGTPSEGASMSLDTQLQYASERLTVALHPQVLLQRYDVRSLQDTNDLTLAASASWLNDRSTFAFTGNVSDLSLLTTELATTGLVFPGTRQLAESSGASWSYAQTERLQLSLQASYVDASYQSQSQLALGPPPENYRGTTFGATESFQRSERLALYATATDSSYSLHGLAEPTRSVGLVLGFKLKLTERTDLSLDGGGSRTSFLSQSSNGFLGDLTLSRATETGNISLSASRSVAPSGFAEVTQQDAVRATVRRDLGPRLSADAAVSFNRYSGVFSIPGLITIDLANLDHSYTQLAGGLNWRDSETWSLGLHVYGNRGESKLFPSGEGWAVRLSSVWTPQQRAVSR